MKKITIGLIAHNSKDGDLVQFIKAHQASMVKSKIIATREIGQLIQARTGLPVELVQNIAQGGDQQIGALVAIGEIDAVIFLREPLTGLNREPDIISLLRVRDVNDVPLATNINSAEAVLHLIFDTLLVLFL